MSAEKNPFETNHDKEDFETEKEAVHEENKKITIISPFPLEEGSKESTQKDPQGFGSFMSYNRRPSRNSG